MFCCFCFQRPRRDWKIPVDMGDSWMIWLRSTLFFILFVLTIVLYATLIVLAWPVTGVRQRRLLAQAWARANRRLLARVCGIHDRVIGLENLPPPPFVLLSKHQSAWETVCFHDIFPIFVMVLKRNLMAIPFFGWALKATGQIPINRDNPVDGLRTLMERGGEALRQGVCVTLFPEGTRVSPGEVGHYNAGGVSLALETGVPIVVVAHNAGACWGKRAFLKRPGVIEVRIAPPLVTVGLPRSARKQLIARVRDTIEGMMAEIEEGKGP